MPVSPAPSSERYVVQPRAPFLAATIAVGLVVVAMLALAVLSTGVMSLVAIVVAGGAAAVVIGRLRARVAVTPDQIEVRTGFSATVVPRRPAPKVEVVKQTLGFCPVLRTPGGSDVLLLPLAGWGARGAAKATAELNAALEAVPARKR